MRRFLMLGLAVAALAFAGCGEDDDGPARDVCADPESAACQECLAELLTCSFEDCSDEEDELISCTFTCGEEDEAACCEAEYDARNQCMERHCPRAQGCLDELVKVNGLIPGA